MQTQDHSAIGCPVSGMGTVGLTSTKLFSPLTLRQMVILDSFSGQLSIHYSFTFLMFQGPFFLFFLPEELRNYPCYYIPCLLTTEHGVNDIAETYFVPYFPLHPVPLCPLCPLCPLPSAMVDCKFCGITFFTVHTSWRSSFAHSEKNML